MSTIYFENIPLNEPHQFGHYAVTKEELLEFASKYDPQPFHIDEEAAKHSVMGALCTSGWHTCAMFMAMLVTEMKTRKVASMGSPGMDSIRWKRPVYVGDTLSVEENHLSKDDNGDKSYGIVKTNYTVKNQDKITVMTMVANGLIAKKPQR